MKAEVLEIIQKRHSESDGKCGTLPVKIQIELDVSHKELQPILEELHTENKIITRKGINGDLIFLRSKKR